MELYHNGMSVCAQKVRLVLAEKNLRPTEHAMNLRAGDTHTPEYLRLNPNGVVPTLVDKGKAIIESTVICEYLDEAYPDPPLKPEDLIERAEMRTWTLLPDAKLHNACGLLSVGVAWRHQIIAAGGAQMRNRAPKLSSIPFYDVIEHGPESPHIATAMEVHSDAIGRMADRLEQADWLAGNSYSLADASMMPYVLRLEHLGMDWMWEGSQKAAIEGWLERSRARENYRGISDYLEEDYIALALAKGEEAGEKLKALAKDVRK